MNLAGYTGPTGQTYTAAPEWLSFCNGWISSAGQDPSAAAQIADCLGQTFWNESQQLSQALGMALGQSPAEAQANFAVSAFTTNNPGPGLTEFQTATNIAFVTPNRFVTFSVDVAAVNCNQTHPLLQFFLVNDIGEEIPAGTQIDPCTGPTTVNVPAIGVIGPKAVVVGTYTTNDPVLISGSSIGVRLVNAQGSGAGNDLAFDNIMILDVTPQLDKSFSSAVVGVGQTSTLTLTVTNTVELAAKNGWSFIDNLPAGLTVAAAATTTCPAGIVTAPIGGSIVSVSGNLDAGTVSCTVTVQVTSSTTGSFTNDASNFSSVVGMSLPNPATLTFTQEPALTIAKSSTTVIIPPVGQTIPYSFLVTNTGNVTMTGIAVTDPNTTGVSCPVTTLAPNESTTCTGTHTVVQADLDAGSVVNTASVVGTPPVGTPIPPMPSNPVTISGLQTPGLSIVKASTTTSVTAVGQTVLYTFTVLNTGNVTITGVAVSDPKVRAVTCCRGTTLAPGSSAVCTGSYTATAGDLDSGQPIVNTATVTGIPPPSAPALPPSSSNTVTVAVVQSPALTIVTSSTTTFSDRGRSGDPIHVPGHQHRQRDHHRRCRVRPQARCGHLPGDNARTRQLRRVHRQLHGDGGGSRQWPADRQHGHRDRHPTSERTGTPAVISEHSHRCGCAVPGADNREVVHEGDPGGSGDPYTFLVTNTGNVTMTRRGERSKGRQRHLPADHHYRQRVDDVHGEPHGDSGRRHGRPGGQHRVRRRNPSQRHADHCGGVQRGRIAVAPLPPTTTLPNLGEGALVLVACPAGTDALLPTTGGNAESMLRIAIVLAVLGAGLIMGSRRRKRSAD